eukprot:2316227-Pleurochrysis_carterae.AAC.1
MEKQPRGLPSCPSDPAGIGDSAARRTCAACSALVRQQKRWLRSSTMLVTFIKPHGSRHDSATSGFILFGESIGMRPRLEWMLEMVGSYLLNTS